MNATHTLNSQAKSGSSDLFTQILDCAKSYTDMQSREKHPKGEFDSANRFYISVKYPCCEDIRAPSRMYPYSQMTHGRSLAHIAHEFSVERYISVLRKISNTLAKKGDHEARKRLYSNKLTAEILEISIGN